MNKNKLNATSPGEVLRNLRKDRKIGALVLANEAEVSQTTLSQLENDSIARPTRKTLEKIIKALDSHKPLTLSERRSLLSPFGYIEEDTLPEKVDIDKARVDWRPSFLTSPFPCYLVDYAQRIHDWNDAALQLLGVAKPIDLPSNLSVFDIAFDRNGFKGMQIKNENVFLREMVRVMKSEFIPFLGLDWCKDCISNARSRYEMLDNLWRTIGDNELSSVSVRFMGPVVLSTPGGSELSFNIIGTDLVTDRRFRVVQYQPANTETIQCVMHLLQSRTA